MSAFKYSAATLALLLTSSLAYAEDSTTTTKPQTGAAVECPAAGTVAEADLTAECKEKAGLSTTQKSTTGTTEITKSGSSTTTTGDMATGSTSKTGETAKSTTGASTDTMAQQDATKPANSVLASQFMGQTVYSATNENVGEINDLVLNKDLNAVTAIIGVGGFLGIGQKDVAIPIEQIKAAKDESNNLRLTIAATKEQLEAAPAFDRTVQN